MSSSSYHALMCLHGVRSFWLMLSLEREIRPSKCIFGCLNSDGHTYVAVLQACASIQDLDHGKVVHRHISESGFALNVFVASSLVDMYVQCGKLTDAYDVFERTSDRNVVLWNAMIAGYMLRMGLVKKH